MSRTATPDRHRPGAGPVVNTSAGRVRGTWRGESAAFLGVPFAAPPVGELRFDAPQPHPRWASVRDADRYGPTPQRRPFGPGATIPEPSIPGQSTLNVNVFTPAPADPDARLPVLVWIHGGGYFAGSPASPWYDGRSFNRDGVVTVSVSYRLGFDGFGWIEDAPPNRGMLDQIAALEWVQANIAHFGGNPDNVTIAGQSAGGGSVLTLLVIERARALFSKAIAQSAVSRCKSLDAARRTGVAFGEDMGVRPTRAEWRRRTESEILDLQFGFQAGEPEADDPLESGLDAVRAIVEGGPGSELAFAPHVDGNLIAADIVDGLRDGRSNEKPLLIGANAHEFTLALSAFGEMLDRTDAAELLERAGLGPGARRSLAAAFPAFGTALLLGQVMTEFMFRVPIVDVVDARSAGGGVGRTWLYDFRWPSPAIGLAAHCHELPFVWDLLDGANVVTVLGDDPPQRLADEMHAAWVAFAREGDPGWDACAPDSRPGLVFEATGRPDSEPYRLEDELRSAIPD